jgi:hypothetical protein
VLALVKTAGLVNPHPASQASGLGKLLELCVQLAFPVGGAGRAGRALGAHIVAHKHMVFKRWQSGVLLILFLQTNASRRP